MEKQKPLQKERDNRSAEKKDLTFHPFNITPESAHTSILLLESAEPEILCQTLRAITKFSSQDFQNRHVLYNLTAIHYILPHVEHPELNIKRFALKALAQLCQLPKGPEQVLVNPQNLRKIAFLLVKVEDVFVLEFASLVLAELTREPLGCEQLVSANILSSLFNRMKNSLDPDVQKNCLQTLSNLLDDPVCASEVTKNHQFSWSSLLALMQSKYLAIQHAALKTVDQLICRYKDVTVQKTFRASTGVLDLCDILESYEFRDVHTEVLGVLRNYVETEENAAHLYQSGCILRLLAYLEMALPAMKTHCLAVLTKMSFTANGREALYDTGTDLVFCQQLLSSNVELLADAAMGVANMTKLLPAAVRMSDTNIIEALCAILGDDAAAWFYIRMNSLRALAELCRIIPKAAFSLVELKTFASLRNINKKYKDNPIEAQRLAVQCYINLQNYHVSRRAMLNSDFMQELINILTRTDTSLKIMTCTALTGLMGEEVAQELFTAKKGEEPVSNNLRIEHIGLRTALCTLIASSVTDEGADVYLELGTIHFMVQNTSARYVVGAWEVALEAIFRHHPSAKFAYTGRLDINDFTQEGFYVQQRLGSKFETMTEIMSQRAPFKHATFIAMFQAPFEPASRLDIRTPYQGSESKLAPSSRTRFPPVPDDVNLRSYLLRLKMWLGDPSKSLHYFEIEDAHYEVSAGKMYEETEDTFLYFAYGSNLLKNRIRINNASAEFLGVGRLENHQLDFIKYSDHWRGSSATIVPQEGSYVWGAIWRLHVYDMPALDKQEGVENNWYFPKTVEIITPDSFLVKCRTYQQTHNPEPIEDMSELPMERRPSSTYHDCIINGAKECGLPPSYIEKLKKIPHNGQEASAIMIEKIKKIK